MNTLYYSDNLQVMREHIADESVDLVYLDPPFNSNASYNLIFIEKNGTQAAAQIKSKSKMPLQLCPEDVCREYFEIIGKLSQVI